MIKQQAIVDSVINNQIRLSVAQKNSACYSCQAQKVCTQKIIPELSKQQHTVMIDNSIDAKIGDTVTIGIEEKELLAHSFFSYFIPLLMMMIMALFSQWLSDQWEIKNEIFVILSSLFGLFSGFFMIKAYHRNPTLQIL